MTDAQRPPPPPTFFAKQTGETCWRLVSEQQFTTAADALASRALILPRETGKGTP